MGEEAIKVEPNIDIYRNETAIKNIKAWCHVGRDLTQSPQINCWTSSLSSTAKYKSESHLVDLFKMDLETGSCGSLEVVIKQEMLDQTKAEAAVCELYADHEIKREIVIGPTVMQYPCPEVPQLVCGDSFRDVHHDHTYFWDPVSPAPDTESLRDVRHDHTYCWDYSTSATNKDVKEKSVDSGTTQHAARAWCRSEDEIGSDVESASNTCYFGDELLAKLIQTRTKETSYKCEICNNMFTRKENLKRHMWTHAKKKPYSCNMCSKQYVEKGSLLYHIATHTGERSYKCDICSKKFIREKDCKYHMRAHTGEKPFKCDVCGKLFTFKSTCNKHMWTHTGEKRFKGDVCGQGLTYKNYWHLHMRTNTEEKRFKCDVCGQGFIYKDYLNLHMRTHTGEKRFKCDPCGKVFTHKDYLYLHMRIHRRKTFQV